MYTFPLLAVYSLRPCVAMDSGDCIQLLSENRKVTFTESSDSPAKYPVIVAKTTWKIESLYGDIPATEIKYSGSLTGKKEIDVLFKKLENI